MKRCRRVPSVTFLVLALILPLAGRADAQASLNMTLRGHLDIYTAGDYNDIWGYTDPNTGNEYALLGTQTGLSVINIVNRAAPYETGFIAGANSIWRDIKTYGHYAYVTNETSGGIAIIDLANPEAPTLAASYTGGGLSTEHNLFIDTATGRLYTAGANLGAGGTRILDLSNPTAPVEIGSWETNYLHDVMVQNGRLYGSSIYDGILYVLDVSNPASITTLGTVSGYPNAFTHNAWVTPDDAYVMTTDEEVGAACRMWDLSGLPTLTQTDAYLPNPATIPHNAHITSNGLAVISHYELGVRVVDIGDPSNLIEVGYYDTYPASDAGNYNGCWGVYPFFPNSPNIYVASDIQTGLYILEFVQNYGTLTGTVSNVNVPSSTIAGASVQILSTSNTGTTNASGVYRLVQAPGGGTLEVSAFGYQTADVPVTFTAGVTTVEDVALTPVPGGTLAGTVTESGSGNPIQGATVEVLSTPLTQASDVAGDYSYLSVPSGSYTVRCSAFGYNTREATINVSNGSSLTVDFAMNPATIVQEFESGTAGWTASNTAGVVSGFWQLGDPQGTSAQPEDDHTPAPGVNAWITELAAGSSVGSFDIDGGAVILRSPAFDVTGMADPQFAYHKWYVTGAGGNTTRDDWVVEISSNGGSTWTPVERTDVNSNGWELVSGSISSFVTPSSQIAFRFTAQDTGAGSITEGGVDDFSLFDVETQSSSTDAPAIGPAALAFSVGRNAPNPFHAGETTRLDFTLPAKSPVTARVYDVSGRQVAEIVNGVFDPGAHHIAWDGRTGGSPAPAGVYFLKLRTDAGERTRKMVVVR